MTDQRNAPANPVSAGPLNGRRPVDRRTFLRGGWIPGDDRLVMPPAAEIASILVQARPDRLEAAEQAIAAIAGAEIYSRDPVGKLVVVVEATDVGAVGGLLTTIALLPDVLTANLVFHATDAG
jgi:nitrate reductase NapD